MFSSRTLDSSSSEYLCFVSADDGDGRWNSKLCAKRAIVVDATSGTHNANGGVGPLEVQ